MWRYLVGAAAALGLITAGFFLVKSMAESTQALPVPPAKTQAATQVGPDSPKPADDPLASPMRFANGIVPPTASEFTKEEKRFNRYDKDKNQAITSAEYLAARRKNYDKLDANGDGVLSFAEYAVKSREKFAKADKDKNGILNRTEFSTTRVIRKAKPRCNPAPRSAPQRQPAEDASDDNAEISAFQGAKSTSARLV
jgi:hypothetical protein